MGFRGQTETIVGEPEGNLRYQSKHMFCMRKEGENSPSRVAPQKFDTFVPALCLG